MKIGERVVLKDDAVTVLKEARDEGSLCLKRALQINSGGVTIKNRWKTSCDEPYWVSFGETGNWAYPEECFRKVEKEKTMQKLISYFTDGISSETLQTIGAEVETQFVDKDGKAVQTQTSQQMLDYLAENGWTVDCRKGNLITTLVDQDDNKIFYELGRHNIEVSTTTSTPACVLDVTRKCLAQLYESARMVGAEPYFAPILHGEEDLLIIPDERDAIWLKLDGRDALAPLARTSSVQFTISVAPKDAMGILNRFGEHIGLFLADFPQDAVWKRYIVDSSAKYLSNRYGGPLAFESLEDYCRALARHDVVQGVRLVPFQDVSNLEVSLYLRSIWWHFRLKRYGNTLCIEVRPMARRADEQFQQQLDKVLAIVCA